MIKIEKSGIKKINFNSIRHSNGSYIVLNLFIAVCGLLFVIFPSMPVSVVNKALGLTLGFAGVIEIIVYFIRDLQNKVKWWDFPFGIFFLLSGIILLLFPKMPFFLILFFPGVFAVVNSVAAFRKTLRLAKKGIKIVYPLLVVNAVSAVFGAISTIFPFTTGKVFAILLGISIFISGTAKAVLRIIEKKKEEKNIESIEEL